MNPDKTVTQLTNEKYLLEMKMNDLIKKFTESTGLTPQITTITRQHRMSCGEQTFIEIKIKLEL